MKTAPVKPKPRKRSRSYSQAFKAAALACLDSNAGNVDKTAKEMRIPRLTLKGWNDNRARAAPLVVRQEKAEDLRRTFERTIRRLLSNMELRPSDPIEKAADAIGKLTDRFLNLIGAPTAHVVEGDGKTTVDLTAALANLTNDELVQLVDLHAKLKGEPPLRLASDLSKPVVVDDGDCE